MRFGEPVRLVYKKIWWNNRSKFFVWKKVLPQVQMGNFCRRPGRPVVLLFSSISTVQGWRGLRKCGHPKNAWAAPLPAISSWFISTALQVDQMCLLQSLGWVGCWLLDHLKGNIEAGNFWERSTERYLKDLKGITPLACSYKGFDSFT